MAKTNEEWELSKENIQPLQQGRKPGVLKVALNLQPDDAILQQRQVFEQELRTYSGDDLLSVWCNYIKWVEQNFPKGGRDGHIEQLIQQCLFILKDEKKYYDDKRFIEIWLKFASVNIRPSDVYDYMYSNNIGCNSACFYITWSWEFEHQGNLEKANQILCEGLQRRAEPYEKMKAYYSEFEMKVVNEVKTNPEDNQEENCRSAFTVLKPGKKKNFAPVVRTGENVVEPGQTLTIGTQQAVSKKNASSSKLSFKIYNTGNIAPTLPVQSENAAPFILYSDQSKENEKKPSKWNKVKAKQTGACPSVESVNLEFQLHCDEAPQPATTPRTVPKVSDVLRMRRNCPSPPMALFEPLDPMKKSMYDKNKVYGGAEEFSLEEIRAAAWRKKQEELEKERQFAEQQRLLQEQRECIKNLQQQLELLIKEKHNVSKATALTGEKNVEKSCIKKSRIDSSISALPGHTKSDYSLEKGTVRKELFPDLKLMTSSYNEAANVVQDLYNGTFINPVEEVLNHEYLYGKDWNKLQHDHVVPHDKPAFPLFDVSKELTSENFHFQQSLTESNPLKQALPFAFYQDPTENFPKSSIKQNSFSSNQHATNSCFTNQEDILLDEDAENIPPEGYVQVKSEREMNGILEPSKNIMFVPLELQEMEDEELNSEELNSEELNSGEFIVKDNLHMQDDTMIPPCNTEQFVNAAFLSSTPCTHLKSAKNIHLQEDVQDQSCCGSDPNDNSVETSNVASVPTSTVTATSNKPICTSFSRMTTREHSIFPYTSLSVIMELSRESYKSSSSGSSAGATQLSQFSSHEKSNTYRHISKTDTFKEPLPPTKVSSTNGKEQIPTSLQEKETFTIHCTTTDPFDIHHNEKLIQSLYQSSNLNEMIKVSNKCLSDLKAGMHITVGDNTYSIVKLIVEDTLGKVYEAVDLNPTLNVTNSKVALKFCKYDSEWEFYICTTLHQRLHDLSAPDVSMSVMKAIAAERFPDSFVLVHEFCQMGTLSDFVILNAKKNFKVPELFTMYLTLEMLQIVSKIHESKIIHGDINPDNILLQDSILKLDFLTSFPDKTMVLKLIDFSRAVDLTLFKNGACFQTPQYDYCIEMREDKPWVFQVDWFGLLNCVHLLLFSKQMSVKKNVNGRWEIENTRFTRFFDKTIWVPLFDELLNIPSCYHQPDITQHANALELKLKKNIHLLKIELQYLAQMYPKNK